MLNGAIITVDVNIMTCGSFLVQFLVRILVTILSQIKDKKPSQIVTRKASVVLSRLLFQRKDNFIITN